MQVCKKRSERYCKQLKKFLLAWAPTLQICSLLGLIFIHVKKEGFAKRMQISLCFIKESSFFDMITLILLKTVLVTSWKINCLHTGQMLSFQEVTINYL